MARQHYDYDLLVIGSGAAGGIAAKLANQAGKRVAIVESGDIGGQCVNFGCIPTKALLEAAAIYDRAKNAAPLGLRTSTVSYNYPSIRNWKNVAVERTGVAHEANHLARDGIKVIYGRAHFISPHEVSIGQNHYSASEFLIATGAHDFLPRIEGLGKNQYLTFKDAVDLNRPPKTLFVVGGGATGCELSELFATFGTKVFISDITARLLPKEDQEVGELLADAFEFSRGIQVLTNSKVLSVAKEGLSKRVYYQHGHETKSVKVDEVLIAAGRLANIDIGLENAGVDFTPKGITVNTYLQTSAKHIYAAGDVVGPYMLTHLAIYQARLAIHNMLHKQKITANYTAIPRITYTNLEVASVGLSEDECIKRDLDIKKVVVPLTVIARANTSNMENGFVKLLADKRNVLLGATIVGPSAGEAIHELSLAIYLGLTTSQVSAMIHAFLSWNDAIRVACETISRQ